MTIFDGETYETILDRMLARIPSDIDKREGSVVYDMLAPAAIEFAQTYIEMDNVLDLGFAESTYGEFLDRKVLEQGLVRKEAIKAVGEITFVGPEDLEIPLGTRVTTEDDISFLTTESVTVNNGSATAAAEAEVGGVDGNVSAGTVTNTDLSEVEGIISATNAKDFSGGVDEESDETLYARYLEFVQRPITSGNKYQYELWAKEIQGIAVATCYPLWNGPGTVKLVVVNNDNRSPAQSVIDEVAEHIEEVRPVGADVTVVGVTEITIDVAATITPNDSSDTSTIRDSVMEHVETYLKTFTTGNQIVRYSQIGNAILDSDNVIDFTGLTVNGGTANIAIESDQVPVIGSVNITIN
jgi:uncharacterized phage protein gp47/JayE